MFLTYYSEEVKGFNISAKTIKVNPKAEIYTKGMNNQNNENTPSNLSEKATITQLTTAIIKLVDIFSINTL